MKINGLSASITTSQEFENNLAILLPGYLDSKDYFHLSSLARELSNIGYLAVSFDPTGTWDSDGDISQYCVSQYLKDVDNIINHFQERNGKPFKEIILIGHSLGGQVALLYASSHQKINTVVSIMAASDASKAKSVISVLPKWKETGFRISKRDLPENTNSIIEFKVSISFFNDRSEYDTLAEIKKFQGKTILLAGEQDTTVEPKVVEEIYEVANDPKKYILLPNISHDYRHNKEKVESVNKAIIEELKLP